MIAVAGGIILAYLAIKFWPLLMVAGYYSVLVMLLILIAWSLFS